MDAVPRELVVDFLTTALNTRREPTLLEEKLPALAAHPAFSWEATLETAAAERVDGLLYTTLRGQHFVPADVAATLRDRYERQATRNIYLHRQFSLAIKALQDHAIPVIVLKGAALARPLYGNLALRPMTDLDLLVPRHNLTTALETLQTQGYTLDDSLLVHDGLLSDFENELLLWKEGLTDTVIEVHWSLLDSQHHQSHITMDWFWDTALPLTIDGVDTQMLGLEAQLLHLVAHLILHHGGHELLWLNDIAEYLRRYQNDLNWQLLFDRARDYDLVLPLQRVLHQVATGWYAPVPTPAREQLELLEPSAAEKKAFATLTLPDPPVVQRFWNDLRAMPSWRARARYWFRHMFPDPAYMRRRYPMRSPALWPLAYPYRWWIGLKGLARWRAPRAAQQKTLSGKAESK